MLTGQISDEIKKLKPGRLAGNLAAGVKRSEGRISEAADRFKANRKRQKLEQELSESLAYIKNIAVLGRGNSISAELLLSELAEFSVGLKPVFLDMAHSLHLNEKDKAAEALGKALGSSCGRDVGEFLASWEDIAPADLLNTIDVYRNTLRESRLTKLKQRDELISDIIYFPVVINCMTVLLNFIYIAYFIEQKEALALFF